MTGEHDQTRPMQEWERRWLEEHRGLGLTFVRRTGEELPPLSPVDGDLQTAEGRNVG